MIKLCLLISISYWSKIRWYAHALATTPKGFEWDILGEDFPNLAHSAPSIVFDYTCFISQFCVFYLSKKTSFSTIHLQIFFI